MIQFKRAVKCDEMPTDDMWKAGMTDTITIVNYRNFRYHYTIAIGIFKTTIVDR